MLTRWEKFSQYKCKVKQVLLKMSKVLLLTFQGGWVLVSVILTYLFAYFGVSNNCFLFSKYSGCFHMHNSHLRAKAVYLCSSEKIIWYFMKSGRNRGCHVFSLNQTIGPSSLDHPPQILFNREALEWMGKGALLHSKLVIWMQHLSIFKIDIALESLEFGETSLGKDLGREYVIWRQKQIGRHRRGCVYFSLLTENVWM